MVGGKLMAKQYFYQFQGRIYIKAKDQDQAEKLIASISIEDYLIDEDIYETDEFHYPIDVRIRQELFDTHLHPLDDGKDFDKFKVRKCRYGKILVDFLHGKYGKQEMLKQMEKADAANDGLEDCQLFAEIEYVDLKDKEMHTIRLCSVD